MKREKVKNANMKFVRGAQVAAGILLLLAILSALLISPKVKPIVYHNDQKVEMVKQIGQFSDQLPTLYPFKSTNNPYTKSQVLQMQPDSFVYVKSGDSWVIKTVGQQVGDTVAAHLKSRLNLARWIFAGIMAGLALVLFVLGEILLRRQRKNAENE